MVRSINKTIQASKDKGTQNKTKLASMVTQVDLDRCSNFIQKVRLERFNQVKARQLRKFCIVCNKNNVNQASNNKDSNNRTSLGVNAHSTDNNNEAVRHSHNKQTGNNNQDSKWVINLSKT